MNIIYIFENYFESHSCTIQTKDHIVDAIKKILKMYRLLINNQKIKEY